METIFSGLLVIYARFLLLAEECRGPYANLKFYNYKERFVNQTILHTGTNLPNPPVPSKWSKCTYEYRYLPYTVIYSGRHANLMILLFVPLMTQLLLPDQGCVRVVCVY